MNLLTYIHIMHQTLAHSRHISRLRKCGGVFDGRHVWLGGGRRAVDAGRLSRHWKSKSGSAQGTGEPSQFPSRAWHFTTLLFFATSGAPRGQLSIPWATPRASVQWLWHRLIRAGHLLGRALASLVSGSKISISSGVGMNN